MEKKLFSKDFTLVVVGQIISLFGNAAVRFALPLYLLNLTGSSALYGAVMACAFIPSILLSPVGGIVADRVNKRNIMVTLDFFTAAVILIFSLCMDGGNLAVPVTVTMMILYGIAGAYSGAGGAGAFYGGKFSDQYGELVFFPDRACDRRNPIQRIRNKAGA